MDTSKSLFPLWKAVVDALASTSKGQKLFHEKDIVTVERRASHEGLAVFTKYLPELGSDIYQSFQTGALQVTARFKLKHNTALPVVFHDLFCRIYHIDGSLREITEDIAEVAHILLTVLCVFKKLSGDYEPESLDKQIVEFIELQSELPTYDELMRETPQFLEIVDRAAALIDQTLAGSNPLAINRRHGSGAVANRVSNYGKWSTPSALSSYDVMGERLLISNWSDVFGIPETPVLQVKDAQNARITFVPKDWNKPRMISMEHSVSQEYQQGLKDILYNHIETSFNPARGYVNFTDQSWNQAIVATDDSYATLDMSEASNRIGCGIVDLLFPYVWRQALSRCRASATEYSLHKRSSLGNFNEKIVINLRTFAPMGSAVCFPVEALVFWAITTSVARLAGSVKPVYVYGDDILVDKDVVPALLPIYDRLKFKLNKRKSYWSGPFRESCGFDRLGPREVTIPKIRHCSFTYSTSVENKVGLGEVALSLHGFLREFYRLFGDERGYAMHTALERIEGIHFPLTPRASELPLGISCTDLTKCKRHAYYYGPEIRETGDVRYRAPRVERVSELDHLRLQAFGLLSLVGLEPGIIRAVLSWLSVKTAQYDMARYRVYQSAQCRPKGRPVHPDYVVAVDLDIRYKRTKRFALLPEFQATHVPTVEVGGEVFLSDSFKHQLDAESSEITKKSTIRYGWRTYNTSSF